MRGSGTLSALLQCALMPLPWSIRRPLLNFCFGFRIHRGAHIGRSLVCADTVWIDVGARIGHLNMIKGLTALKLHNHASIGNLNWVSGIADRNSPFFGGAQRISLLEIEEHAAVTNRHLLDCINAIHIGAFTTFAGFRSQILTHSLDLKEARQASAPVHIGRYCFIGTGVIVLGGAVMGDYCVLAAGSMLRGTHEEGYCLLSGVPAQKIREIDRSARYFERKTGFIY